MASEPVNNGKPLLSPLPLLRCCNKGAAPFCGHCWYCREAAKAFRLASAERIKGKQ